MAFSASQPGFSARKELGAFYTPATIARELVRWAIRLPSDTVLDPSFGSLVFLEAARDYLRELGARDGDAGGQLYGVEVDGNAFDAATERLRPIKFPPRLIHQDFFGVRPGEHVPAVSAVVGNPPYLRYQGFNGRSGCFHALATAAASVELTGLASSWAPFVIHAVRFVAAGGRLAHILPGQFLHAQYAQPVKEFLRREFRRVAVVAFEERIFPSAQEEIVLLLADERGGGPTSIEFFSFRALNELDIAALLSPPPKRPRRSAGERRGKLLAELLPRRARRVYDEAEQAVGVTRFGDVAQVDIGTVTGANSFFLLPDDVATRFDSALFERAIGKAVQIKCARFTTHDYESLQTGGAACRLLLIKSDTPVEALKTIDEYLREGEAADLHERNKCRSRTPWWSIKLPREPIPDLFLTYCAHHHPRLVLNEAGVMHTNTIHGVTARGGCDPRTLAVGFYNSLTMLSSELLARSYGGGVLKLEPTEAEALLMPPLHSLGPSDQLLSEIDTLVRDQKLEAALDVVDELVLRKGLGLDDAEIASLRQGAERLRRRRHSRRKQPPDL